MGSKFDTTNFREGEMKMIEDAISGAVIGVIVVAIFYFIKGRKQ